MPFYTGSLGTVSNCEDWQFAFDVVDENGADVNITAASITLAVRAKGNTSPNLTKTVGSGITIATPTFTVLIPDTDLADLVPGQYDVGCVVEIASLKTQFIIGTVTIVDGIVA